MSKTVLIDCMNIARGGGATVAERLAVAFADAGWTPIVLASTDFRDVLLGRGDVDFRIKADRRGVIKTILFRMFELPAYCRTNNIDASLSFNFHSGSNTPEVTYHINTIPFLGWASRKKAVGFSRAIFQRVFSQRALRRSDLNVFESKYLLNVAGNNKVKSPDVAYIGTELPNLSERAGYLAREIVVVTSGQAHKRNAMALDIFKEMDDPEVTLTFVGNADAIKTSLGAENLSWALQDQRIQFAGYLTRDQLFEKLHAAWCLLNCSELESFYMVAVEAMAVGCPVVVADETSADEAVQGNGLLFKATQQAVAHLNALKSQDYWLDLSHRGQAGAKPFDADACARAFVEKFETVLGKDD